MIKRIILVFLLCPLAIQAQDIEYARRLIEILCSPALSGRGYVSKGDSLAAVFIAGEFENSGLHAVAGKYFQPFTLPVNIFPGEMCLALDGIDYAPGIDFLVSPSSPQIHGVFRIKNVSSKILLSPNRLKSTLAKSEGRVLMINKNEFVSAPDSLRKLIDNLVLFLQRENQFNPSAVLLVSDAKLTWSAETFTDPHPLIYLKSDGIINPRKISLDIDSEFIPAYVTHNVISTLSPLQPEDSLIVVTAHYDHLGEMGKNVRFPGANDNASGVSLMLNLAREFTSIKDSLHHNMAFIAFSGEDAGLWGSEYFVKNPVFDLGRIKFLINLDLAGTGDEGITVVNATMFGEEFDILTGINDRYRLLPAVKSRGPACNSDHCLFYEAGVPCFFMYTMGGITAYHDLYDRPELLPLTEYEDYFKLIKEFILTIDKK